MRCENCGRPMKNAELWQLGGDPNAPTSSSMRSLCWECRNLSNQPENRDASAPVVGEASEVVRRYEASQS